MSYSSSAVPERIMALANNERLLVSKSGLGLAVIATLLGGVIVSENHAKVLANAIELAEYKFNNSESARSTYQGNELLARTLGIRLHVIEVRGTKTNMGSPTEGFFGAERAPEVKLIVLETRAKTECYSFVGSDFQNNLLTQSDCQGLLRILSVDEVHTQFPKVLIHGRQFL